jgi:hypothetical protein
MAQAASLAGGCAGDLKVGGAHSLSDADCASGTSGNVSWMTDAVSSARVMVLEVIVSNRILMPASRDASSRA